jgi:hypothetical protein
VVCMEARLLTRPPCHVVFYNQRSYCRNSTGRRHSRQMAHYPSSEALNLNEKQAPFCSPLEIISGMTAGPAVSVSGCCVQYWTCSLLLRAVSHISMVLRFSQRHLAQWFPTFPSLTSPTSLQIDTKMGPQTKFYMNHRMHNEKKQKCLITAVREFTFFFLNNTMSPVQRGAARYAYTAEGYCAVRVNLSIWLGFVSFLTDRAMAQTVIHRTLTAETRVQSQVSACEVRSGQSSTGTGFSPSILRFPCQHNSTNAPYLSPSMCRCFRTDRRVKHESLPKKQCSFENQGAMDGEVLEVFRP